MQHTITLTVNGVEETHAVAGDRSLLSFLRDTLDLTGVKEGCNEGECGACVVLVDGKAVNSCLVLAAEMDGRSVTTVEGLSRNGQLHPIQQAFLDQQAIQCGFCSPGVMLTALSLLNDNPDPSEEQIREALSGNLCRCTGYKQIIDAVQQAATVLRTRDAGADR